MSKKYRLLNFYVLSINAWHIRPVIIIVHPSWYEHASLRLMNCFIVLCLLVWTLELTVNIVKSYFKSQSLSNAGFRAKINGLIFRVHTAPAPPPSSLAWFHDELVTLQKISHLRTRGGLEPFLTFLFSLRSLNLNLFMDLWQKYYAICSYECIGFHRDF